jgi:hypothetical protein
MFMTTHYGLQEPKLTIGEQVLYRGSLKDEYGPEYTFTVIAHETTIRGFTYIVSVAEHSIDVAVLRGVRPASLLAVPITPDDDDEIVYVSGR